MWVRGLKLPRCRDFGRFDESHPMWVRGLKQYLGYYKSTRKKVAPHVGAWIETTTEGVSFFSRSVAPHVGAWIETNYLLFRPQNPR